MTILLEQQPRVLAYDTDFDRRAYQNLYSLRFLDKDEFQRRKEMLDAETSSNLRTHLGERFNVLLSELRYNIRDGVIYGENNLEPAIDIFIRGRNYRRAYGNPADFSREDAEIEGFRKIQDTLGDPTARVGDMMLSISSRGGRDSVYKHNFYDVFTLREDRKGRYLEARRYGSSLDPKDYSRKLKQRLNIDVFPNNVAFLSNPILIDPTLDYYQDAESIHRDFYQGGSFMDTGFFNSQILENVGYIADRYIEVLNSNPENEEVNLLFNAYLNQADRIVFPSQSIVSIPVSNAWMTEREILFLGMQAVREVMVGCGFSGGSKVGGNIIRSSFSPFSVADFGGYDSMGALTFNCPGCGQSNTRPVGGKLENCRHCPQSLVC